MASFDRFLDLRPEVRLMIYEEFFGCLLKNCNTMTTNLIQETRELS
jgi:hypothetical protein